MRERAETATLRPPRVPALGLGVPSVWRRAARGGATRALLGPALLAGELLPRPLGGLFYETIALGAYLLAPRARRRAEENIAAALDGEGRARDARRVARASFRTLGRNAVDVPRLRRISPPALACLVRIEGFERLEAALSLGRGVVGIAPHLGNWEVLAAALAARGVPLSAVAARLFDPRLERYLRETRARWGVRTIVKNEPGATREAVSVLQRGEMLGVLMDLRTRHESVEVPFLGRESRVAAGAIRLARRARAPIVPMAIARAIGGGYVAEILDPLDVPSTRDPGADLRDGVRRAAAAMEGFIRRWPEQWVWMHERWPDGAADR